MSKRTALIRIALELGYQGYFLMFKRNDEIETLISRGVKS